MLEARRFSQPWLCLKGKENRVLTLPIYSDRRSWRAWRTELHSATMRSLRSSRVHEESAMRAAPLMMLSRRSSREGRKRSSLKARGSTMICFYKDTRGGELLMGVGGGGGRAGKLETPHIFSLSKHREHGLI